MNETPKNNKKKRFQAEQHNQYLLDDQLDFELSSRKPKAVESFPIVTTNCKNIEETPLKNKEKNSSDNKIRTQPVIRYYRKRLNGQWKKKHYPTDSRSEKRAIRISYPASVFEDVQKQTLDDKEDVLETGNVPKIDIINADEPKGSQNETKIFDSEDKAVSDIAFSQTVAETFVEEETHTINVPFKKIRDGESEEPQTADHVPDEIDVRVQSFHISSKKKRYQPEKNQFVEDEEREQQEKEELFEEETNSFSDCSYEEKITDERVEDTNSDETKETADESIYVEKDAQRENAFERKQTDVSNNHWFYVFTDGSVDIDFRNVNMIVKRTSSGVRTLMKNSSIDHTVKGMDYFSATAGAYVISTLLDTGVMMKNKALKHAGLSMLNSERFDCIRSSMKNDLLSQLESTRIPQKMKHKSIDILHPQNSNDVHVLKKVLSLELESREIDITDIKKLKRELRKEKFSDEDSEFIRTFLAVKYVEKLVKNDRFRNYFRKHGHRMSRSLSMAIHKIQGQNYTVDALFMIEKSKRSIKTVYRTAKSISKLAYFGVRLSFLPVKFAHKKVVAPVLPKTRERVSKTFFIKEKVYQSEERSSAKVQDAGSVLSKTSQAVKNAKMNVRSIKMYVKRRTSSVSCMLRSIKAAWSYLIAGILTFLLGIFLLVLMICSLGFFSSDSDWIEDESQTLAVQQYIDALVDCHTQFNEAIQALYDDSSYETVNISYVNEKNEAIYDLIWGIEDGTIVSDGVTRNIVDAENNIQEILCMTFALFQFDTEDYSTTTTSLAELLEIDQTKVDNFLENNDLKYSTYNGTYQRLLRSYLVALFNGSHKMTKRVEVTYCEGCIRHVYYDDDGMEHEYHTCPGHKHLYATVTTYYFDDLFSCKLSQYPQISGSASGIIGSSTVEKVWNALINMGCTEQAAAGAIGNLMWESGGGPNDINLHMVEAGSGEGIGMVQWSFSRKQKFLSFLESRGVTWPNAGAALQIEFMIQELNSGEWLFYSAFPSKYNVSLSTFMNCTSVEDATWYWCANYERPNYTYAHIDTRITYAQNVYNTYHGKTTGDTLTGMEMLTSLGDFTITYYCPCYACSEGYGTTTATGTTCKSDHTIAVDPSVIPYGSKVLINGIVYTAEDCGGGVKGNHIDIYVDTHEETIRNGVHSSCVYLIS